MTELTAIDKLLGVRTSLASPDGLTIAEMISRSRISPILLRDAEVWIEDQATKRSWMVPRDKWDSTKPKPHVNLVLRAYGGKGGGGGKSVLGIVLSIAVLAVAAVVPPLLIASPVVAGLVGAGIGKVGPLYIGKGIPK